jgi:predicted lipoprotein with Yx(FWY)xxD motif
MNAKKQVNKSSENFHRVRFVRRAGAVLAAIGGLSISVAAVGPAAGATSTVSTIKTAKYGTILVSGRTVYTLKASKVACGTGCHRIWPEVLLPKGVTTTTAGSGVNAAHLGTVAVSGGALQVTYAGKPLYYFFKDSRPGQVNGNLTDQWGKWSVVVTVKSAHPGSGSGTTSAGSGGVSF